MSGDGLRVHFDPQGALLEEAHACEGAIFSHWYGNTNEQLAAEYGPYESTSVFVALADGDRVVGTCRLIVPGPAGLKSVVDAGREPWSVDGARSAAAAGIDLSTTWDVATLGILPGSANSATLRVAALYHGVIVACQVNNISAIVAVLDNRVRRLMSSMGLVLHTLPGATSAPYLGSPASTPVYAGFANLLDTQRRLAPDAYRLVTLGVGLDGVSVPARSTFRLERPTVIDLTAAETSVRDMTLDLTGDVVPQR